MSEEEIIEIILHLCVDEYDYWLDNDCKIEYEDSKEQCLLVNKALQGILDLYQKEKEKNAELKTLIEHNLKYTHNLEKDLFENCSNYVISKDKIKAKIEELENEIKGIIEKERDVEDYQCEQYYKIQVLQELLLEEE